MKHTTSKQNKVGLVSTSSEEREPLPDPSNKTFPSAAAILEYVAAHKTKKRAHTPGKTSKPDKHARAKAAKRKIDAQVKAKQEKDSHAEQADEQSIASVIATKSNTPKLQLKYACGDQESLILLAALRRAKDTQKKATERSRDKVMAAMRGKSKDSMVRGQCWAYVENSKEEEDYVPNRGCVDQEIVLDKVTM